MSYRVQNASSAQNRRFTCSLPERTRFFICEEPGCGKCRRVDAETVQVFSNAAWRQDELKELGNVVLEHLPTFHECLDAYVSRVSQPYYSTEDFHACEKQCTADIPNHVTQGPLWHHFFETEFLHSLR